MRIQTKRIIRSLMVGGVVLPAVLGVCGCGSAMQAEPLVAVDAPAAVTTAVADSGNCCVNADSGSPRTGCNDADVESCVCAMLPSCCTVNWSVACVGIATQDCSGCSRLAPGIAGLLTDSDGDGLTDLEELATGLDPFNRFDGPDIDGDGIPNGDDPDVDGDVDGDGELNAYDNDVDGDGIGNLYWPRGETAVSRVGWRW